MRAAPWIFGAWAVTGAAFAQDVEPAVAAVERVGPTVVNLSTERLVERHVPAHAKRSSPARREGARAVNLGSGVIVDPAGFVLTNAHVVARASRILVGVPGLEGRLEGELLAVRYADDLALVKVQAPRALPAVELGSARLASPSATPTGWRARSAAGSSRPAGAACATQGTSSLSASSRPTPRSTRATPAGRWSTCRAS